MPITLHLTQTPPQSCAQCRTAACADNMFEELSQSCSLFRSLLLFYSLIMDTLYAFKDILPLRVFTK